MPVSNKSLVAWRNSSVLDDQCNLVIDNLIRDLLDASSHCRAKQTTYYPALFGLSEYLLEAPSGVQMFERVLDHFGVTEQ